MPAASETSGEAGEASIRAVILDLDDTLLDTTGVLAPTANREAARALVAAGVPGPLRRCERLRARAMRLPAIRDPDLAVCRQLGVEGDDVAERGRRAFYCRAGQVRRRGTLRLIPGARAVLAELSRERALILVTWGDPETQWAKIRTARMARFFEDIRVVDRHSAHEKAGVIGEVLRRRRWSPMEVLVVGDSWERDILAGRRLGTWTCWVRRGTARSGPGWPPLSPDAVIGDPLDIPRVIRRVERRLRCLTRSRASL